MTEVAAFCRLHYSLRVIVCCLLLAASTAAVAARPAPALADRITGLAGLENVARVAPGLYRGAQPTDVGLDSLKALGIKTVVNLRHYHGVPEAAGCRKRHIDYEPLVLASSHVPSDAATRRFLQIVTDPARQPVYFHCWRGKDRTGVMCAAYRMAVEHWTLDEALAEMYDFGFYRGWRSLHAYVESLPPRLSSLWTAPDSQPLTPIPAVITR
jgi:tyrosine-protein phosphatase SIW14